MNSEFREADKAYAAAMLDGEGTIYANYLVRKDKGNFQTYYYIGIVNKSVELLEWLREKFGGTIYTRKNGIPMWQLTRLSDMYFFLKLVRPYMIIKCDVADLMIKFIESRMNTAINNKSASLTNSEKEMLLKIKRLNETRYDEV